MDTVEPQGTQYKQIDVTRLWWKSQNNLLSSAFFLEKTTMRSKEDVKELGKGWGKAKNNFLNRSSINTCLCIVSLQCLVEARPVCRSLRRRRSAWWSAGCLPTLTSSSTACLTLHWPELKLRTTPCVSCKPAAAASSSLLWCLAFNGGLVVSRCWCQVLRSGWCWSPYSRTHVTASWSLPSTTTEREAAAQLRAKPVSHTHAEINLNLICWKEPDMLKYWKIHAKEM